MHQELAKYCTFKLGDDHFGMPIHDVQEVIETFEVSQIPLASPYVKGLINLRGHIITVFDLKKRIGVQQKQNQSHEVCVIVKSQGELVGFIIDEVEDVVDVATNECVEVPSHISDSMKKFLRKLSIRDDKLLLILDVDKILSLESLGDENETRSK